MSATDAVRLLGISCRFGSVQALHGADCHLAGGEIHALLGENGAGKTTLMRALYGLVQPDDGVIEIAGVGTRLASPRDAIRHGVGMVQQHDTVVERMTVAENVWLGRAGWRTDLAAARETVRRLGDETGLSLDPDAIAGEMAAGRRQRLEILKALAREPRVLILDEPTSSLAPPEVDTLYAALRRLRGRVSIVLITHKLRDIAAIADRVTVLRQGRTVLTGTASTPPSDLAAAMIGSDVRVTSAHRRVPGGEPVLVHGPVRIQPGEIVGIAAVEGNGQRELMRNIASAGSDVAFIPEERQREALIPEFTVEENLAIGSLRGWRLSRGELRRSADRAIAEYGIRTSGATALVRTLSGGNQQKLVLARALASRPRVLIAENPTRGLDVQATAEVHARIRQAATEGCGVLFYSTDLDEVLELADRVVVMAAGSWIEVAPGQRTRERIGALMVGAA